MNIRDVFDLKKLVFSNKNVKLSKYLPSVKLD